MRAASDFSFDTIVKRFRQPMAAAAYHLCGDREAAQDIVQETLMDAYRGLAGLREPEKVGAWLYAILRRKAIAHRKTRKPEVELVEDITASDADTAESLVREIIIGQMTKLDESDREILAGKYLIGLSYKELAESLGIKEGAVRVRCLRAKERLRTALQGSGVKVPRKREGDRTARGVVEGDEHGM
jgi:RNA polymerase sigma-70 factor, ECF subfamily